MRTPDSRSFAVAITGGIGSGKTEAAKIFSSLGVKVLYADQFAAHLVDSQAEIRNRIRREFGERVVSREGTLNRKVMAQLVFTDNRLKEKLDAIVHPPVLEAIDREIEKFKRSGAESVLMVEAALIFEARADSLFDYVIVVDAPEEDRIARIMKRDRMSRAEAVYRIRSQIPAESKVAKADFVIRNSGDRKTLERNCRFLHRLLLAAVRTSGPK
ncbi:MAG: dephospho-CoA kinase [Ignavibacteria bacterium 13_1_40CM_2_61_4]|nr:MAG: dephospho-CoA kinase [Ignavibacteria bacterium 13_1_40CM_2_61_4]